MQITSAVRKHRGLIIVLAGALAIRLALAPFYSYLPNGTLDEGFWKHWMEVIHQRGVLNIFRESDTDYVGYHWVLWILAVTYDWIGGLYDQTAPTLHILVKIPSIVFDAILIATVYTSTKFVVNRRTTVTHPTTESGHRLGLAAAAICAFQPAVLYDSAVWAQTDAAISAAMLGSLVLAYRQRPGWAGFVFALGFAIKPHPVIIGPLLALALFRNRGARSLLRGAAAGAATIGAILMPWILHGDAERIRDVYTTLFTKERERLSELAWNIWWIPDQLGDPRPDSAAFGWLEAISYERLAFTLSACATLLALAYACRHRDIVPTLIAGSYQVFAFYELPIGSHERYLYPMLVLLLPVVMVRRAWAWMYAAVSTTLFLNLVIVAPPIKRYADDYVYGDFGVAIAAVNTGLFAAFTAVLVYECIRKVDRGDTTPATLGDSIDG